MAHFNSAGFLKQILSVKECLRISDSYLFPNMFDRRLDNLQLLYLTWEGFSYSIPQETPSWIQYLLSVCIIPYPFEFPNEIKLLKKKFFISDSYYLIINANDQNNIVSKIWENPFINYFSTYRLCIDRNFDWQNSKNYL